MLQPGTPEYEQAKAFVEHWKIAAPVLDRQRERDIRAADTVHAMAALGGMIDMAIREMPPRPGSGLIEVQRWFMQARERQEHG